MLNTKFSPWPSYTNEEINAVHHVLKSNRVNYWTGEECQKFEKEYAEWIGVRYAIALSNGTVALDVSLQSLGIGLGDEVIVTSRTFLASVSSIVNVGAKPIFADVDSNSQNISLKTIEKLISPKTKAILCVHLAGWPCDMDPILSFAENRNLFIIEDCAQAHGAQYKGKMVGSFGDVAAWSFCQDKIITTGGEGGMITTNSEKIWDRIWSLKDHGKKYDMVFNNNHSPGFRWVHESFGSNYRMTEMQAAIGRIQLKKMPKWTTIRNRNALVLNEAFAKFTGDKKLLRIPRFRCNSCPASDNINCKKKCVHAYYKYYVFIKPNYLSPGWSRDIIIDELVKNDIPCNQGSCSEVYLEKAFDGKNIRPVKSLPVAKKLGETSIMLLVHPSLAIDEMRYMARVACKIFKRAQI